MEMNVSKELGCHLVQGYFVQRPSLKTEEILPEYVHVKKLSKANRRVPSNKQQIKSHIERIEPIYCNDQLNSVLERFQEDHHTALPIVGKDGVPLGTLDEDKMKKMISSPFGRTVFLNESSQDAKIKKYVQKCAMIDIHTSMDQIIEGFSNYKEDKGIIITRNMQYYGFLSASSIIGIINERNLASAQDQNPLTKMPGNHQINQYIGEHIKNNSNNLFVYFDLNHFKAYNDNYGFRNGDRVIQLFADKMKKELPYSFFKGHIGGDDFFSGLQLEDISFEEALHYIEGVLRKFSEDVQSMYTPDDRERGYIIAKDRENIERSFELLGASAVVVGVHHKSMNRSVDMVHQCFALQKKVAKLSDGYMNITTVL
jgi:diguanylate cyclase (GGDEF)-like protein